MLKRIFVVLCYICLVAGLLAQSSSAIHYTVRDGLPSSTVYSISQDGRGFIWIGTEAGLARFDGSAFRIYTTQDGLPDNEVLGLLYDSTSDRLWITTYSKMPCYYHDGKLHNSQNDTALAKVVFDKGEMINAVLQPGLGIFLSNGNKIYRCTKDAFTRYTLQNPRADIRSVHQWSDTSLDVIVGVYGMIRRSPSGERLYPLFCCDSSLGRGKWIGNSCFLFHAGSISVYRRLASGDYDSTGEIRLHGLDRGINIMRAGGRYIIPVYNVGIFVTDTSLTQPSRPIWTGRNNDAFVDDAGNIWITTSDDGIYVIRNSAARNFKLSDKGNNNLTTLHYMAHDRLYCGNTDGQLFVWQPDRQSEIITRSGFGTERMRGITSYDSTVFLITSRVIARFTPDGRDVLIPHWGDDTKAKSKLWSGGQKCLLKLHDNETIMIGLLSAIGTFHISTGHYHEVTVPRRIIAMAQHPDGRVFCGSLDGVFQYAEYATMPLRRLDGLWAGRVTSMCFTPDSLLWIGTPSDGILIYNGQHQIGHINPRNYLSYHGAICRRVLPGHKNEMWVATNSGVNRIRYHYRDTLSIDNITPLNITDGLLSDDVNDIVINDSMVFIATAEGLTVLNEHQILAPAGVPVYISSIRINDRDSLIHDQEYSLRYDQNNLRIEYVGVSLPSADNMRYEYRLLGSGSDRWTTTTNTSIDFRSLSAGTYTFEVVVLDKFGVLSKSVARIRFKIAPAFYNTWWFWAIIMVTILVIGFMIIRDRFRRQQRRLEHEQSLHNKIIELEQQALKAQMNPHFIFNCLTAVQHFVNTEDMYSANMYLSNFARLIRKTLDLSGEQYIALEQEISYLQDYVQMECLRFGDKFTYTIDVPQDMDTFSIEVPPMLLQPIVENAIRHGLRNLGGKPGKLLIAFVIKDGVLYCTIDDNGIGRAKARDMKTTMHVEYQSKGMALTEMRIQAINQISDKKIRMEVKDKYDDNNQSDGTLFILAIEQ